jgi:hypothetical protein
MSMQSRNPDSRRRIAMSDAPEPSGSDGAQEKTSQVVDSMTGTFDQWRARIDELKVQADLAKLDARELASRQLDIAQNVCLAAYSKLRDARHDASVNADTLREGLQKLLSDLKDAFEAAQAVIDRG